MSTHVHETICAKTRRFTVGRMYFPDKLFGDDVLHLFGDGVERFYPPRLLDIYFAIASGSNIVVACVMHICRLAPNEVTADMSVLKMSPGQKWTPNRTKLCVRVAWESLAVNDVIWL